MKRISLFLVAILVATVGSSYIATAAEWFESTTRSADIFILDPPDCDAPTALIAGTITVNNATLTWASSETDFVIQYKPSSVVSWDAPGVVQMGSNTNSITFGGLLSMATTYDVRVQAVCNPGVDTSDWVTTTFTTICGVISSFPWVEGFETDPWPAFVAPGNVVAPACWINLNMGNSGVLGQNLWSRGTTTHSGIGAAQCRNTANGGSNNEWLITPQIALTGNERLRFWVSNGNATQEVIQIFISDANAAIVAPTSASSTAPLADFTQLLSYTIPANWNQVEIDLSAYSGNRYIAFVSQSSSHGPSRYIRLDDVEISTIPSCPAATNLTASNLQETQVTLDWTNGNPLNDAWKLIYKAGAAITWDTVDVFTKPFDLTGLTASTQYQAYLLTDCGGTLAVDPSNTITFGTTCSSVSITSFPWFDGFENGLSCWTLAGSQAAAPNGLWRTMASGTEPNCVPHGGATMAQYNSANAPNNAGNWTTMASPQIDFSQNRQLTFWMYRDNGYSTASYLTEGVYVYLNTTPDTVGGTLLGFTPRPRSGLPGWESISYMIPSNASAHYLVFKGLSQWGNNIYLDDITVADAPNCPTVHNFDATFIGSQSVRISWDTNAVHGNSWTIAYSASSATSFDPNTATSFAVLPANLPYIISNLTPGDTYSFAMANCAGEWTAPVQIITPKTLVPYFTSFDDLAQNLSWLKQSNNAYLWAFGGAVGAETPSNGAAYISNDNGDTHSVPSNPTYAYLYKDIDFGTTPSTFDISFDWMCAGRVIDGYRESVLMFYLRDPDNSVMPLSWGPTWQNSFIGALYDGTTWTHQRYQIQNVSGVKRLIFFTFNINAATLAPAATVDNLSITYATCIVPTTISSTNLTTTTADISWNNTGADSYLLSYKENVSGATFSHILVSGANNYTLTSLNSGSFYDYYVRAICGTDTTTSSVTYSFQTPCIDLVTSYPWAESFESGSLNCWILDNIEGRPWDLVSSDTYPTATPHTGSFMARYYTHTYGVGCWGTMATPKLDFPEPMKVSFWLFKNAQTSMHNDKYWVYVNSTPDTIGGTVLATIDPDGTSAGWYYYTLPISHAGVPIIGQQYIVFKGLSGFGESTFIDDITVNFASVTCDAPSAVVATDITASSATINWAAGGTESNWLVEYKLASDATWTVASPAPTTTTASLTALLADTLYEVRVKSICGLGDESIFSVIYSFRTAELPPPTCTAPTGVAISNNLGTSVTVSWTGHGETSWDVLYALAGSSNYTSTLVTASTYTLTSLEYATRYEVCIIAHCDMGINSEPTCAPWFYTIQQDIADINLNNNVKLYPNPASDKLAIDLSSPFQTIEITNLLGQVIYTANVNTNILQLDVSKYTAGVYFVKLQGKEGVVTKKFVKK